MKFRGQPAAREELRTIGNHSFTWTNDHIPKSHTDPLRHECDELGAAAVKEIQEIHSQKKKDGHQVGRADLFETLSHHHSQSQVLSQLWTEVHTVPYWVDWDQIARGQKFFYRYALANLIGFAFQGFVGENSASTSVVEVLARTGGFSTRVLRRRLLETFQLVLQVTHSLDHVKPGGPGHRSIVRVRLLHSMVRQQILKVAASKCRFFDQETHGIPINTLDSIHAIATFSCNHAWLQLPLMGITPEKQEVEDYIALWRYVAHVIGAPQEYFTSATQAKAVMESLAYNELLVTPTSVVIGHNFVEALKDLPPINISDGFIQAASRVLNGHEICDQLGMGRPSWYSYACFRGHCWLVWSLASLQRWIPALDDKVIDLCREGLHGAIIHSNQGLGGGSILDFKYVPDGRIQEKEKNDRTEGRLWFFERPLEFMYFVVFVIGCMVVLAWLLCMAQLLALGSSRRAWGDNLVGLRLNSVL
ncbi:transcriptional regulator [Fusarium circinatum]|uniref:Transcriptional regulator n=1 Tax=Fusarium circinatum TaxID=48490 RepID=A0A8H5TTU8_FUSCI|nr:transcriptional regulator [Fusarium circinatum]